MSQQNKQENEIVNQLCKSVNCFEHNSCHSCEMTKCCNYILQTGNCETINEFPFNYTEVFEMRGKAEVKNISEYPDPLMNVTFPKCNINTEIPLYKATNFLFANQDKCGKPSYCPTQEFYSSSETKISFQQGIFQVKNGELCSLYFQGKMGPDFLIHIGAGAQLSKGVKSQISICLSVGMFDDFPCLDITQPIVLTQTLYYKIRANQFRITLMFTEEAEVDFSKLYYYIISNQKMNQQYQQQLFQFIIILLLTILVSMMIIGLLKAILVRIFGREILDCIDPEPLLPRRSRQFNCAQEFEKLKNQQIIKEIKLDQIKFEQDRCPFCLEQFNQVSTIEICCGHCFHEKCLKTHFQTQQKVGKCSICQKDINIITKRETENQEIRKEMQNLNSKPLIKKQKILEDEQELELSVRHSEEQE